MQEGVNARGSFVDSDTDNVLDDLGSVNQGDDQEEEEEDSDEWGDSPPAYNLKRRGGFLDGEDNSGTLVLPKIGNAKGQIKLSTHMTSISNRSGVKRGSSGG